MKNEASHFCIEATRRAHTRTCLAPAAVMARALKPAVIMSLQTRQWATTAKAPSIAEMDMLLNDEAKDRMNYFNHSQILPVLYCTLLVLYSNFIGVKWEKEALVPRVTVPVVLQ